MIQSKHSILSLSLLLSVLFVSCRTYNQQAGIAYLRSDEINIVQTLQQPYSLKIKPDDELKINISSTVPSATSQYNLPAVNYVGRGETMVSSTSSISTYTVSESGHIVVPNIGKIKVSDMTPEEVADLLTEKISETVKDPLVKVDLQNFHVVVLGAVGAPGTKSISCQRCSIFDAIGAAEDITLEGRKDNVVLMREHDGKIEKHILDLTDASILQSPYYFLQQNDVIMVDATEVAKDNSTYNSMNSFKLQTASTIVSAISVVVSLCIALFIK